MNQQSHKDKTTALFILLMIMVLVPTFLQPNRSFCFAGREKPVGCGIPPQSSICRSLFNKHYACGGANRTDKCYAFINLDNTFDMAAALSPLTETATAGCSIFSLAPFNCCSHFVFQRGTGHDQFDTHTLVEGRRAMSSQSDGPLLSVGLNALRAA